MKLCPTINKGNQEWRFLGIFAKNREEWMIASYGAMSQGITIVPPFESLGPDAIAFILNQTDLYTICIDKKHLKTMMTLKSSGKCPSLCNIISFDPVSEEDFTLAQEAGLELHTYDEVMDAGKLVERIDMLYEPKPEDIYMFCYTSGTTGDPKAAMISHRAMIAAMSQKNYIEENNCHSNYECGPGDVAFSYLPMAHIYE